MSETHPIGKPDLSPARAADSDSPDHNSGELALKTESNPKREATQPILYLPKN